MVLLFVTYFLLLGFCFFSKVFFFFIYLKHSHNFSLKQFIILKSLSGNPKFAVIIILTFIDCHFSSSLRFFCVLVWQVIMIKTGIFIYYFMRLWILLKPVLTCFLWQDFGTGVVGTTSLLFRWRQKSRSPTWPPLTLGGCHYCSLSKLFIIKHHCQAGVQVPALHPVSFDTTVGLASLLLGCGEVLTLHWDSLRPPQWGCWVTSLQLHNSGPLHSPLGICWHRWKLVHEFFVWCLAGVQHLLFKSYYFVRLPLSLRQHALVVWGFHLCPFVCTQGASFFNSKYGMYEAKRNENNSPLCVPCVLRSLASLHSSLHFTESYAWDI